MPTVTLSPDGLVRIEGGEIVTWALDTPLTVRVPAPEGEAWRTVPVEPTEAMIEAGETAAWDDSNAMPAIRAMRKAYAAMLATSPVVPVEVRRRVLDELDKAWLHGQRRTSWRRDESADAILAALRPTDTGRE
jgi:hypothetical protein